MYARGPAAARTTRFRPRIEDGIRARSHSALIPPLGAETPEAVIAPAEEEGFTLSAEDMQPESASGELSDDELGAVAGGDDCGCAIAGAGVSSGDQGGCGCWLGGVGAMKDNSLRCVCPLAGGGVNHPI